MSAQHIKNFLILFVMCLFVGEAWASFEDFGRNVRPLGMDNAFTAVCDDLNSFLYNPAGLSQLQRSEITTMYAGLLLGLDDASSISDALLGYGQRLPGDLGAIGCGWSIRNLANYYQENVFYLSYARPILPFLFAGFSFRPIMLKYEEDAFTKNDPVFSNGYSKMNFGIDLGLLLKGDIIYKKLKGFSVGINFQNLNQPDMGLEKEDKIPLISKLGLAYKLDELKIPLSKKENKFFDINDLLFAFDTSIQKGEYQEGDYNFNIGIESWFLNRTIGLRTGFGIGSRNYGNFAIGASYYIPLLKPDSRIDYAFFYSPVMGTAGNHYFSFTMEFGEQTKLEKEEKIEEEKAKSIKEKEGYTEEIQRLKEQIKKIEEDTELSEVEKLKKKLPLMEEIEKLEKGEKEEEKVEEESKEKVPEVIKEEQEEVKEIKPAEEKKEEKEEKKPSLMDKFLKQLTKKKTKSGEIEEESNQETKTIEIEKESEK